MVERRLGSPVEAGGAERGAGVRLPRRARPGAGRHAGSELHDRQLQSHGARRRRHHAGHRGGERCHRERIDLVARRPVLLDDGPGRTGAVRNHMRHGRACSAASRSASARSAGTSRATTRRCTSPRCNATAAGTSARSVPSSTSSIPWSVRRRRTRSTRCSDSTGRCRSTGTVTLGQPVQVSTPLAKRMQVYTVDAHAGQHIVGEVTPTGASDANPLDYVARDRRAARRHADRRLVQPVPRTGTHASGRRHVSHRPLRGDEQPLVVHRLRHGGDAAELLTRDNFGSTER